MKNTKILIVDDGPQARRILRAVLVAQGFEINDARRGEEAIEQLHAEPADIVLLELGAPGGEALEACRGIRASSEIPIIIVVSAESSSKERAHAFEAGADQVLSRPFTIEELFARIRAVRWRAESLRPRMALGDTEVDFESREVRRKDGVAHLTAKEFKLLHCLASHRGEVVSHRRILQTVWGPDYGDEVQCLRVHINQLRKKVEPDPANPKYILTDHTVGYRLNVRRSSPRPYGEGTLPRLYAVAATGPSETSAETREDMGISSRHSGNSELRQAGSSPDA